MRKFKWKAGSLTNGIITLPIDDLWEITLAGLKMFRTSPHVGIKGKARTQPDTVIRDAIAKLQRMDSEYKKILKELKAEKEMV